MPTRLLISLLSCLSLAVACGDQRDSSGADRGKMHTSTAAPSCTGQEAGDTVCGSNEWLHTCDAASAEKARPLQQCLYSCIVRLDGKGFCGGGEDWAITLPERCDPGSEEVGFTRCAPNRRSVWICDIDWTRAWSQECKEDEICIEEDHGLASCVPKCQPDAVKCEQDMNRVMICTGLGLWTLMENCASSQFCMEDKADDGTIKEAYCQEND